MRTHEKIYTGISKQDIWQAWTDIENWPKWHGDLEYCRTWTKLDKMTVSKALKKLVTTKLVSRTQHKTDTRAKTVMLTNKGTSLINKLVPIIEHIDEQFFGKLIQKEQIALKTILSKLTVSAL